MLEWFTTRAVFGFLSLNFLAVLLLMQERHNVPHRWAIGGLALITLASLPVTAWLATRRETAEWVAMAVGRFRFWRAPPPIPELRAIGAAWHAEGMSMLGSFGNQAHLVVLGMVSCVADLTCLRYSLYAAGVHPSAGGLVVAYGAGIVGSLVPFLPAGLGAVETIMPAVLHRTGVAARAGAGRCAHLPVAQHRAPRAHGHRRPRPPPPGTNPLVLDAIATREGPRVRRLR